MGKYTKVISIINKFIEINKITSETNIDIKTLEHLGELVPQIHENIEFLHLWLEDSIEYTGAQPIINEEIITPTEDTAATGYYRFDNDADWKPVNDMRLWCSTSGLIYSEDADDLLIPKYHNGDYMVTIDESDPDTGKKRAGVIVARAFRIQSEDRTDNSNVLEYRNGDRKDIRPENLYWRQFEQYNLQTRTIEDICRRIIEYNGDIEKIMSCYDENDRFASRPFVRSLLDKKQFASITDRFFIRTMSGKIVVRQQKSNKPMGADIGEFLRISKGKDIAIARELLIDKIKADVNTITVDEEAIMVFDAVIEGKKLDNKSISKYIRDTFGYTIAYDTIEIWKSDKTNKLYQMMGGKK